MTQFLNTYLLEHKSVSIPGLGTIYVERVPAKSDFVNRQLLPPAYHYRFDKYFDAPEKEFFTFLALRKNVPEYEAMKLFNEWAMSLRNSVNSDHLTSIEGVGGLKRDESGEIVFDPSVVPKTFDVAVPAERIIRTNSKHIMLVGDRERTNVEMSDYLHGVQREKGAWWIVAIIIVAISLLAIFFHYYKNGSDTPYGSHQTINVK
ncbi:MAG: hypothetical protein ABI415_01695 [Flavitalea sp.]